ncbi:hypothetical protein CHISP_3725 [Chitinispirillum alkaliphilum]|nr:hypothetical protein CHISP_3725 [Chitinispirillum alkaliphilum]
MSRKLITLIVFALTISLYSQDMTIENKEHSLSGIEDRISAYEKAVQIYAFGLLVQNLAVNYEILLQNRHGLLFEGNYQLRDNSFGVGFHYRNHYHTRSNHRGLNSPFWGPYIVYGQLSGDAFEEENFSRDDFTFELKTVKLGLNWGRRWVWNSGFSLVFRIGYGIPVYSEYQWFPHNPKRIEDLERLLDIFTGIDGEFTIGWAF